MSESAWVLKGVDPAARERAAKEAVRRGVPLADYLTDIVLQKALAEQMREQGAALLGEFDAAPRAVQPGDGFAVRHRLKALERRLGSSILSLDGALNALDTSLFDLTARVGDVEGLAGDTAHALGEQVRDLHGGVAVLRLGLSNFEDVARASNETNYAAHATLADACGELEHRLDAVEAIARGADRAAAALVQAQHAHRLSVADDVEALSRETTARVSTGLEQVRAAADDAARQADAAAADLIAELRELRQSIDERLIESANETKNRMHAAFAEAADRMAALSDRITVSERRAERHVEQVRAQVVDVEDGVQSALEETALALRRADALLAADIVRMGENGRVALDALRTDLAADTADMRERQLDVFARVAHVEASISGAAEDTAALRDAVERRLSASTASLLDAIDQAESTAARTSELEQDIAHVRRALGAEINRVEACTLAALEKQSRDRAAGDAASKSALDDMRHRLDEQLAALRGQQAGAQARLDCVDAALAADGPFATVVAATADEVASLRSRVLTIQASDREIIERVGKLEHADGDAQKALDILRGHIDTVAAQVPAGQVERLHNLERSVADLRLGQLASGANAEALNAVEAGMAALEQRQTEAFHTLRNDIARFVGENDRRLALLEVAEAGLAAPFAAIEQRLAELEQRDVGAAFAELRGRIEDRIAGLEQRNVRTLEHLSETVSLIERRLLKDDAQETALSA